MPCRQILIPTSPDWRGAFSTNKFNAVIVHDEAVVWLGCSRPPILVALRRLARAGVMAGHEHQIAADDLQRPDHGRQDTRRKPVKPLRRLPVRRISPRLKHGPSGWKATAAQPAVPNHRPTPEWRLCWLEVECNRCKTRASLLVDAIRRPRDTPIWKLEAALKCRSCRKGRYAPPVHMIKLTAEREITP
jgi:hypothetical protein